MVLCGFIERETHNFILKFRESFPWKETVFRATEWKSVFFYQIYAIFWEKIAHFVIDRYFSLFLKGFEDFS